ncbi:hypothetical protein BLA60_41070 [Actinophytocola xinjiangensis]|uniref:DUF2567 domain-containing protein n=1 Tax=Actinophytocola xinjiangensis TaxID=485602 RepID=A0A7Z1AT34_9PSEU|nr:DUF2567 domain-containing protein [Actinophytocola xinjiangensis]OLF04384.1 hypothetical protein BLA60_41070 [Actinophytocola xinjiangensis]
MAEQPVGEQGPGPLRQDDTAGDGVVPEPQQAGPPPGYPAYFYQWYPPRPRVVVRADLLPAVSVLATVSMLGFLVGWLWSLLAPATRRVIGRDGEDLPLSALTANQAESYHRGDALVIFLLLGLAAGLCTGLAVWFLRGRRGPVVMIAAVLGSGLGGWLAVLLGESWAAGRYPLPAKVEVLDVIRLAPVVDSQWVLLAWPLTTALMYGVMAAWNSMDDLGRRLG